MSITLIMFFIDWGIVGIIAWMMMYYSAIKDWYITFGEDYNKEGRGDLVVLKIAIIVITMGGPISLGLSYLFTHESYRCLYFRVPLNQK